MVGEWVVWCNLILLGDLWCVGEISMHAPPTGVSYWQLKLWVSSIVQLFDFLTIDILCKSANFGHSFDILIFEFLLKPPQPSTGLFLISIVTKLMCFGHSIKNYYYCPPMKLQEGNVSNHVSVILFIGRGCFTGPTLPLCRALASQTCSNLFNFDLTVHSSQEHSILFTMKQGLLASGWLAFDWNAFLLSIVNISERKNNAVLVCA